MTIKERRADNTSDGRGVATALAHSINWESLTILIKFVGHTKTHFEFIFGLFQSGCMVDENNVATCSPNFLPMRLTKAGMIQS
jgi:hypothetical protein